MRYVYVRCLSRRKSVKVVICICEMAIKKKNCESCGMYMSDVYQEEKVLKLGYVFMRCLSTRKSVKLRNVFVRCLSTKKVLKLRYVFV